MLTYDAIKGPNAEEWLAADEQERLIAVKAWHAQNGLPTGEIEELHAIAHVVAEYNLADSPPPALVRAFAAAQARGVCRHGAVHAIGMAVTEAIHGIMSESEPPADFIGEMVKALEERQPGGDDVEPEASEPLPSLDEVREKLEAQGAVAADVELRRLTAGMAKRYEALEAEQGRQIDTDTCFSVLWLAATRHLVLPDELTPEVMEDVVFELIPRRVVSPRTTVPGAGAEILADLRGLVRYLADSWGLEGEEEICESLGDDRGAELSRAMSDLRRFGAAKSMLIAHAAYHDDKGHLLQVVEPPPPARAGRNDPCPCGSGKKYKKCCLRKDQEPSPNDRATAIHGMDRKLTAQLVDLVADEFSPQWIIDSENRLEAPSGIEGVDFLPWFSQWLLHDDEVDGERVVDLFLAARGHSVTPREREWLEAQSRAWPDMWDVLEARKDEGLRVRSLETGEERFVHERAATASVTNRQVLLARLVDFDGLKVFAGIWPQTLDQRTARAVLQFVHERLAQNTAEGEPPAPWLAGACPEAVRAWLLQTAWRDAVEAKLAAGPPELRTADGSPFLLTRERFTFPAERRDEITAAVHGESVADTNVEAEQASPEADAMVAEMKAKHYQRWLDEEIPALEGLTPREAARDQHMRSELELMLIELEAIEARAPEGQRFDVSRLREALFRSGT